MEKISRDLVPALCPFSPLAGSSNPISTSPPPRSCSLQMGQLGGLMGQTLNMLFAQRHILSPLGPGVEGQP